MRRRSLIITEKVLRQREKWRAQSAVSRAIENGTLVRLPCEVCGEPNTEAHHDDHSKPLEVKWLCRKHHYQRHADLGRLGPAPESWKQVIMTAPSNGKAPSRGYSFSAPPDLMARLDQRVPKYGDRSKVIALLIEAFLSGKVIVKVPERKL